MIARSGPVISAGAAARDALVELPVRWISQEGAGVLPSVRDRPPAPPEPDERRFLLALDGGPLACTARHSGRIDWLPGAARLT